LIENACLPWLSPTTLDWLEFAEFWRADTIVSKDFLEQAGGGEEEDIIGDRNPQ